MNQRHSMKLSVFRASTSWNSHRTQKHSATAFSRRKLLHFYVCRSAHCSLYMHTESVLARIHPVIFRWLCGCCCSRLTCDGIPWCLSLQQSQRYVLLFCFEMIVHAEIKSVLMMMEKRRTFFDGTKIVIFVPFAAIQRKFVKCLVLLYIFWLPSLITSYLTNLFWIERMA